MGKSKTEEYILYVCLFLFIALLPLTKIADFDLFFHMRLGQYIWDNTAIYGVDEFSFASAGPQFRGEWLGNLLIYSAYRAGGFYGLGIMKSLLFLILSIVIFRTFKLINPEGGLFAKAAALIVFAYALRFRLDLRPYYFTYISLSLFMYFFLRYRNDSGGLYGLIPLQVFWSNAHSGSLIGPPLVLIFLITESIRRRLGAKEFLPFFLLFASSGLNPEGFSLYESLLGFASSAASPNALGEWQPLTTGLLWGFGLRYTFGFQVIFLGVFIYLIREAVKKRADLFIMLLASGSLIYSIRHVRLMDVSSIMLAPVFYLSAERILSKAGEAKKLKRVIYISFGAFIIFLIAFSIIGSRLYCFGFGLKDGVFPDGALRFMDENKITGNGFNTVTVGSYILWGAPDRKVFIDGRLSQPASVQQGYERAIKNMEGFGSLDEKYNFAYALVDYNPKARWRFPFHLNKAEGWALLYWDRASALYLKETGENKDFIEKRSYRVLRPSFNNFTYLDGILHLGVAALKFIDHDISLNPRNEEAHLAKAYAAYYLGMRALALSETDAAIAIKPDTAFELSSKAFLLMEMGDGEGALKEAGKALRLDPYDRQTRVIMEELKAKKGH